MTLILKCEKCNKSMGSLEPFTVKDDKYMCKICGEQIVDAVKEFYENVDPDQVRYFG